MQTTNCQLLLALDRGQGHFSFKGRRVIPAGSLIIVSPPLRPFWPLSGRNSTYSAVKICQASSIALLGGELSNKTMDTM